MLRHSLSEHKNIDTVLTMAGTEKKLLRTIRKGQLEFLGRLMKRRTSREENMESRDRESPDKTWHLKREKES